MKTKAQAKRVEWEATCLLYKQEVPRGIPILPKQPILNMVIHSGNPSSGEAEAGKSLVLTGQLA